MSATLIASGGSRTEARPARRTTALWGLTLLALVLAITASVVIGARSVPPSALWDTASPNHGLILARLPRTALAVLVGAALAVAGTCMQGLTRNPLADPGILGLNAGASFTVVIGVAYFGAAGIADYLWLALLGATLATGVVYGLATLAPGGVTPVTLTLTGAAVTAAVSSWTSGLLLLDQGTMDDYRHWQVGSVGGRDWEIVLTGLPLLALGLVIAMAGARSLDALALGDDLARGLGRRTGMDRLVLGVAIVLLCGVATAIAGPIGFLGLVVPHLLRPFVGPGHPRLLPLAAAWGAVLALTADTLGRVVLPPTEVQLGVMTAVVGVPVLLVLLRRGRMTSL